jgi:HTH-type transcriptional repressor of NAD biosynthesis genes
MTSRSRGLVLGKFMPPHLGHVHLIEVAQGFVDELDVVVGTLASEPIPGALRHAWMTELFPRARVLHLDEELPQEPSEHPRFWDLWRESLTRITGEQRTTHVFASEKYGHRLASELGARFIPVDVARAVVPVSGTRIRQDPIAHWDFLPRCVRPYFTRRVCVFGPESTGKSTLARSLAAHFHTAFVPEYARTWLEEHGTDEVRFEDLPIIARAQVASEEALARNARGVLFSDTDALTTTIWSEALFGRTDPEIEQLARRQTYALTLLLDVDVPWVADPVRYLPAERKSFFDRCRRALDRAGRPYVIVSGDFETRTRSAIAAVEELLLPVLTSPVIY